MPNERRRDAGLASIIDQIIEMRAIRGLPFVARWLKYCGIDEQVAARVMSDAWRRRPVVPPPEREI
ncbi:hypothetical protein SAMN05880566_101521 [Janthinobacterium sp. TND4EL3]|uniref:hypothetical protein n=1 Tax=Janthinobacterium sp. TND4EL3 TaxID=1907311 RepID=UPI0009553A51|nr:hypothetical protein [Janthinobacterium sp. TND4EL3]SIQ03107.1 hypothetical protein SAMN05880566_101521 [Janthinobacterium sp. TND4EL3]